MAEMSLTWTLHHHGWAVCRVADQQAEVEAVASYVTNGPEQLLTAVANIVIGAETARAEFEAEPVVYRWAFQRHGSEVEIRLLEVPSARLPDQAGTVVWTSNQSVDTLARVLVRAFDAVAGPARRERLRDDLGSSLPTTRELDALRAARRRAKQPEETR